MHQRKSNDGISPVLEAPELGGWPARSWAGPSRSWADPSRTRRNVNYALVLHYCQVAPSPRLLDGDRPSLRRSPNETNLLARRHLDVHRILTRDH